MRIFILILLSFFVSPLSYAQIAAHFGNGGSLRLGSTDAACTATLEGAIRWSSSLNTIEICDGQSDWRLVVSAGNSGAVSTPSPQPGYFVLSKDAFDGARGGRAAIHDLCLQQLQDNDWMGKADAAARGLLNATHVKPWLCFGGYCEELAAGASYKFAVAGNASVGGGSFTAGLDSLTLDSQAWNGPAQFGATYTYWTGREAGTATVPGESSYSPCGWWNANDDVWNVSAATGISSSSTDGRWAAAGPTCANTHRFICVVHP